MMLKPAVLPGRPPPVRRLVALLLALMLAPLASCQSGASGSLDATDSVRGSPAPGDRTGTAGTTGSPSLAATTAAGLAQRATAAGASSRVSATAPSGASGPIQLTWWIPDFISPSPAGAAGALVARYIAEFESSESGRARVIPIVKAGHGRGGLLDLMRAARPVAPGVLPDLVALDTAELPAAAAAGLLQPLNGLISEDLLKDLYPFARQAGLFDGHIVAIPIVADVEHVIYNQTKIKVPPATWTDLRAADVTYLFPAGNPLPAQSSTGTGEAVQNAFVSHYLSAGGTINAETRQLILEETPLLRVLTFYSQATATGILPPQAVDVAGLEECWSAYEEGAVTIADVSARRFLAGRDRLADTGSGLLPGWNNPAVPVASGWSLAIITVDPDRQRAAAAWIAWLLAPERLGPWTQAAGWLPVRPTAWHMWLPQGGQPYYDFLQAQLASAVPMPSGPAEPQAAVQLQKAAVSVLRNTASPAEAARAVLTPQPPK